MFNYPVATSTTHSVIVSTLSFLRHLPWRGGFQPTRMSCFSIAWTSFAWHSSSSPSGTP